MVAEICLATKRLAEKLWRGVKNAPSQRTEWGQPIGHTGVVLAVGSAGVILRSLDYGQTWGSVNSLSTGNLNAITWASPTVAFIVGANGRVLISADGGARWLPASGGISGSLLMELLAVQVSASCPIDISAAAQRFCDPVSSSRRALDKAVCTPMSA